MKKFVKFFGILKFLLRHVIYIHLLTWVGFGLIGYVPNTLYMDEINSKNLLNHFRSHAFVIMF
jgi:hypothetical protein